MDQPSAVGIRLAVTMSRFPKLTETFILSEVLELRARGVELRVLPLVRQRDAVVHPEAAALLREVSYLPFLSPGIVVSNLRLLVRRPRRYLGALWRTLRETWGSLNFTVGALGIFPKVAHLALELEAAEVQHLHCHFASHPAVAGFVVHRLTGVPYSFTAHGSDLHVDRHMLCTKTDEAAFVVTVSEYNRRMIEEDCPAAHGKVHVIRAGVDLSLFRFEPDRGRRDGVLEVVAVGTLHEVKGQGHLVRACTLLRDAGVEVHCQLVGEGADRRMLERLVADLRLGGCVELSGALTRQQVAAVIAGADVLVAPSVPTRKGKREGIPVVLIEAMAVGTPVVASDISGIPELVRDGETGLLTAPGDPESIAAAVRRIHGDPALARRLATAARAVVEAEFDVAVTAQSLLSLVAATRA